MFIFGDVLDSTGFDEREPSLREALHVFEVLKKELPSQMHGGEAERESCASDRQPWRGKMNSIRGKIVAGFLVMMAFIVAQYFLVDHYLERSRVQVELAIKKNYAASSMLSDLTITGQAIRRYEKEYFIYHDDAQGAAKYAKEWEDLPEAGDAARRDEGQLRRDFREGGRGRVRHLGGGELAIYGAEMREIRDGVARAQANSAASRPARSTRRSGWARTVSPSC